MYHNLMRRAAFFLAAISLLGSAAWADYEAGQTAWQAGRHAEALTQWRTAARTGDDRAMLALGRAFAKGLGVPQDYVLAHMWLNLAAGRGNADAAAEREALAAKMTPQQIASAQERARVWRSDGPSAPKASRTPRTAASSPPPRAIREAQGLMAALGYKPGPADGVWGRQSVEAYRAFLRDARMAKSDMLTPDGLRALRRAAGTTSLAATEPKPPAARTPPTAHRAAAAGDIDGLKAALAAGADANARDGRGWTALMHAANKGYTLLVPPLLKAGADPNLRAADGATALFIAALHGHSGIVALLVKAGANPTIEGPKGKTAEGFMAARVARTKYRSPNGLHKALRANESAAVIKALLDLGADIDARDVIVEDNGATKHFYTPFHTAARYSKRPAVITLLLERGASLNDGIKWQFRNEETVDFFATALMVAAAHNENPDIVGLLLDRGADINAKGYSNSTPLHSALFNKNLDILRLLLERGADVNTRINYYGTPLSTARDLKKHDHAAIIEDWIRRHKIENPR